VQAPAIPVRVLYSGLLAARTGIGAEQPGNANHPAVRRHSHGRMPLSCAGSAAQPQLPEPAAAALSDCVALPDPATSPEAAPRSAGSRAVTRRSRVGGARPAPSANMSQSAPPSAGRRRLPGPASALDVNDDGTAELHARSRPAVSAAAERMLIGASGYGSPPIATRCFFQVGKHAAPELSPVGPGEHPWPPYQDPVVWPTSSASASGRACLSSTRPGRLVSMTPRPGRTSSRTLSSCRCSWRPDASETASQPRRGPPGRRDPGRPPARG